MEMQTLNLFIVDDNPLMAIGLKNDLDLRFGANLNISIFYTGESALKKVDKDTSIVILDYHLGNENGNEVLKSIKEINPNTEVIMFSCNEDIRVAVESFRKGASDYVIKGDKAWKKINSIIYEIIIYPVKVMVREFGVHSYDRDFKKN